MGVIREWRRGLSRRPPHRPRRPLPFINASNSRRDGQPSPDHCSKPADYNGCGRICGNVAESRVSARPLSCRKLSESSTKGLADRYFGRSEPRHRGCGGENVKKSTRDRHGGSAACYHCDIASLDRFQAQLKWEISVKTIAVAHRKISASTVRQRACERGTITTGRLQCGWHR